MHTACTWSPARSVLISLPAAMQMEGATHFDCIVTTTALRAGASESGAKRNPAGAVPAAKRTRVLNEQQPQAVPPADNPPAPLWVSPPQEASDPVPIMTMPAQAPCSAGATAPLKEKHHPSLPLEAPPAVLEWPLTFPPEPESLAAASSDTVTMLDFATEEMPAYAPTAAACAMPTLPAEYLDGPLLPFLEKAFVALPQPDSARGGCPATALAWETVSGAAADGLLGAGSGSVSPGVEFQAIGDVDCDAATPPPADAAMSDPDTTAASGGSGGDGTPFTYGDSAPLLQASAPHLRAWPVI